MKRKLENACNDKDFDDLLQPQKYYRSNPLVSYAVHNFITRKTSLTIKNKYNLKTILERQVELGNTSLHFACQNKCTRTVDKIIDLVTEPEQDVVNASLLGKLLLSQDSNNKTCLHHACAANQPDNVDKILKAAKKASIHEPEQDIKYAGLRGKLLLICLHHACATNQPENTEKILKAARMSLNPSLLDKLLLSQDSNNKTCLHHACAANQPGNVDKILEAAKEANVNEPEQNVKNADLLGKLLLGQDSNDRTCLHYACATNQPDNVEKILKAAKETNVYGPEQEVEDAGLLGKLLLSQDSKQKTCLHYACGTNQPNNVEKILQAAKEANVHEPEQNIKNADLPGKMLLSQDSNDRTCLHYACATNQPENVKKILKMAKEANVNEPETNIKNADSLGKLPLGQDSNDRTCLHYACATNQPDNVENIQNQGGTNPIAKEVSVLEALLLKEDKQFNLCLHLADSDSSRLIHEVIVDDEELKDRQGLRLLTVKDQSETCFFDNEKNNEECLAILKKCHQQWKECENNSSNAPQEVCLSYLFPDFCIKIFEVEGDLLPDSCAKICGVEGRKQTLTFSALCKNHPLKSLARSRRLEYVKHPYIQFYLETCWRNFVRYIFYIILALFLLFLGSLLGYITCHTIVPTEYANGTDGQYLVTDLGYCSAWRYSAVTLTCLGLLWEGLQLYIFHPKHYFTPTNIFDLFTFISVLTVTVLEYNPWVHLAGCALIVSISLRVAVMLTHVAYLGIYFKMFLAVVKNVFWFSPVLLFFIIIFAFVFHNMISKEISYSNWILTPVKLLIMSTGEFNFDDILYQTGSSFWNIYDRIVAVMYVLFVIVMAISMMNLLIVTAIPDITKLAKEGEQEIVKSQVDLLLEYSFIFRPAFRRIHRMPISKLLDSSLMRDDEDRLNYDYNRDHNFYYMMLRGWHFLRSMEPTRHEKKKDIEYVNDVVDKLHQEYQNTMHKAGIETSITVSHKLKVERTLEKIDKNALNTVKECFESGVEKIVAEHDERIQEKLDALHDKVCSDKLSPQLDKDALDAISGSFESRIDKIVTDQDRKIQEMLNALQEKIHSDILSLQNWLFTHGRWGNIIYQREGETETRPPSPQTPAKPEATHEPLLTPGRETHARVGHEMRDDERISQEIDQDVLNEVRKCFESSVEEIVASQDEKFQEKLDTLQKKVGSDILSLQHWLFTHGKRGYIIYQGEEETQTWPTITQTPVKPETHHEPLLTPEPVGTRAILTPGPAIKSDILTDPRGSVTPPPIVPGRHTHTQASIPSTSQEGDGIFMPQRSPYYWKPESVYFWNPNGRDERPFRVPPMKVHPPLYPPKKPSSSHRNTPRPGRESNQGLLHRSRTTFD